MELFSYILESMDAHLYCETVMESIDVKSLKNKIKEFIEYAFNRIIDSIKRIVKKITERRKSAEDKKNEEVDDIMKKSDETNEKADQVIQRSKDLKRKKQIENLQERVDSKELYDGEDLFRVVNNIVSNARKAFDITLNDVEKATEELDNMINQFRDMNVEKELENVKKLKIDVASEVERFNSSNGVSFRFDTAKCMDYVKTLESVKKEALDTMKSIETMFDKSSNQALISKMQTATNLFVSIISKVSAALASNTQSVSSIDLDIMTFDI